MVTNPTARRGAAVALALVFLAGFFAIVESPLVSAAGPGEDCAVGSFVEFPGEGCDPCAGFPEGTCDPCVEFGEGSDCRPCPNGATVRGGCHPCGSTASDPCPPCVEFLGEECDSPSLPPGEPAAVASPGDSSSTYRVRAGDTLGAIAGRLGVSLGDLLAVNPEITNPNLIRVGAELRIPGAPGPAPTPIAVPAPTPAPEPTPPPTTRDPATTNDYIVRPGDSFGRIAFDHGLTLAELIALNPQVTNPGLIFVGDVVIVAAVQYPEPPPREPDPAPPTPDTASIHIVGPGDALGLIAARNGLSVSELLALNPSIANPNLIFIGDRIVVG